MINNQQDTNRFSFLLLSGGVGQRSDHYEPKQFYELHGHPLIAYSLIAATQVDEIAEIIVNSPPGYEERTENILKAYCRTTSYHIIESGKSRQESCHRLAKAANFAKVIVHEAARPFVTPSSIKELVCEHEENSGYFLPISFSICKISSNTNYVVHGVPRDEVHNILLPQKFDRETLLNAHGKAESIGKKFNEDSVLCVEMLGINFKALPGEPRNIKVTTNADFAVAEQIIREFYG